MNSINPMLDENGNPIDVSLAQAAMGDIANHFSGQDTYVPAPGPAGLPPPIAPGMVMPTSMIPSAPLVEVPMQVDMPGAMPEASPAAGGGGEASLLPDDPDLPDPYAAGGNYEKKIGSDETATTSKQKTADYNAANQDLQAATGRLHAAGDAELKSIDDEAKAEADLNDATAKGDAVIQNAYAKTISDSIAEEKALNDRFNLRVEELKNMKRETFWGSKSTADKLSAALSIGLGSFGQAMTGSGQNIGQLLLTRQMDEFAAAQDQKYEAAVKEIDSLKVSMDQKIKMRQALKDERDAKILASHAQVQADLGRQVALAKTGSVKAAAMQKQALADQKVAEFRMSKEAEFATTVQSRHNEDLMKNIQAQGVVTKKGEPLNSEQSKAFGAYVQMRDSLNNMKQINEFDPTVRSALQQYSRDMQALAAATQVPVGGKAVEYASLKGYDTAKDRLKARSPEAYTFIENFNKFIGAKLRDESGSAIGAQEYLTDMNNYGVGMNDSDINIKQKHKARYEAAKSTYTKTGI